MDGTGRKEHEARSCGSIAGPRTRGPDDISVQGCGADTSAALPWPYIKWAHKNITYIYLYTHILGKWDS